MLQHVNLRRRKQYECCYYQATDESIQIPHVATFDFERTNSWSIVVWFKTTIAGFRCFISKGFKFGSLSGVGRGWEFSLLDGKLHTRIDSDDGTNGITKQTTAAYHDGAWHHAVLTYAGTSLATGALAYADGAVVTFSTVANTLTGTIRTTQPLEIGMQDTSGGFLGHLDEIAIYNKVLSAGEVATLYNEGIVFDYTTSGISNLVGYWRMAEGSTYPTIPDISGGNNHGTMLNMQQYGPTRTRVPRPPSILYAIAFGGTNEYGTIGDVVPLRKERTDSFSILARVRTSSAVAQIICGKMGNLAANQGYDLHMANSGRFTFNLNNSVGGSNYLSMRTVTAFNDGQWHDVLVTYGGTSTPAGVHIHVDGIDQALTTVNNTLSATIATTASFRIGARLEPGIALPFIGDIKDVAMWNTVVSGADVLAIYQALPYRNLRTVGPDANLVGYWQMGNSAMFPTIPDSSLNNNVVTLTNMEAADIFQSYP